MIETCCSKCGRRRPDYIADPTCPKGGYCDWQKDEPVAIDEPVVIVGCVPKPHDPATCPGCKGGQSRWRR